MYILSQLKIFKEKMIDPFEQIFILLSLFIYFERDRETQEREGQRKRESQAGSFNTVSTEPEAGLELTNHEIMT